MVQITVRHPTHVLVPYRMFPVYIGSTHHSQGVAEEDEARSMVGKVFGYLVERGVNGLVFVLSDLVGVLIDHV